MNVCIFYYDGFCEFEAVFAAALFAEKNLFTAALEDRFYISSEKQKFLPDKTIDELNTDDIDLFIISGGDPSYLYNNSKFKGFITDLNKKKKFIAGICGGTFLMAKYGILENKKCTGSGEGIESDSDYIDLFEKSYIVNEDVVIDGNIITSTGQAFIEFAIELGKLMNVFKDEEEAVADYKWLKNIKE